jgi:hypothetical protein
MAWRDHVTDKIVAAPIPSLIALIAGRQVALKLELGFEVTIVISEKGRPGWAGRISQRKCQAK